MDGVAVGIRGPLASPDSGIGALGERNVALEDAVARRARAREFARKALVESRFSKDPLLQFEAWLVAEIDSYQPGDDNLEILAQRLRAHLEALGG